MTPPSTDEQFDAYAARTAHQLGEAIAVIRASASLLRQGGPGGAGPDAWRGLDAGLDRIQRFLDDLLDVTAVSRDELHPVPVDLQEVLDDARATLGTELARAGTEVRAAGLPAVTMDRRQADRLLVHLLRAALAAEAHEVSISGTADGATTQLEVRDDGAAPTGDRPFEPFEGVRGRGPLVGAGSSLVLCRRVVERHGGTIALASDDGETVVTIALPTEGPPP